MRVISNALLTLSLWSESLHSLWSYERYLSSILHGATDVTNAICCKMKAARVARTRRAKAFMRPPDCGRDSTIRTFICISPAMARKAPCIMCAHEKSFFSLSHFTPTRLGVGSCTQSTSTSHPGVLGSIPKREEPGKTGAPCDKVPGSSRVPVRDDRTHPHRP